LSWHILDGHFDDTPLTGLDVVLAGFYRDDDPAAGSPWEVALYIDERATDAQHDRLADIYLGRVPGTAESNYAAAIRTVHGVHRARIDLEHGHQHWKIGVDGRIAVDASEKVDCDETVACGIPGMDHPGQELRAGRLLVDEAPLQWDLRGRCAFATDFDYRGSE